MIRDDSQQNIDSQSDSETDKEVVFLDGKNVINVINVSKTRDEDCLLYTSPSPRDLSTSRMPSSA